MAENVQIQLNVDAGNGEQTIAQIKSQVKELTAALGETIRGSKEYNQTLLQLAERKADLKDLRDDIKALDPGEKLKAIGSLAQGLVGGFTAATSAVAAFGGENEDLQKVLVKVNAAIGLLQGVQAVFTTLDDGKRIMAAFTAATTANTVAQTANATANTAGAAAVGAETVATVAATTATRSFSAALLANPITAIVAGLALLVGGIYAYVSAGEDAAEITKKLNDELVKLNEAGLSSELSFLKRAEEENIAYAKSVGKSEDDINKIRNQSTQNRIASLQRAATELRTNGELNGDQILKIENQIKEEQSKLRVQEFDAITDHNKKISDENKKAADKRKQDRDKELAEEKAAYEKRLQDLIDLNTKLQTAIQLQQADALNEVIKNGKATTEVESANYSERFGKFNEFAPKQIEGAETLNNQIIVSDKQRADAQKLIDKNSFDTWKELNNQKLQASANIADALGQILGNLGSLAAEGSQQQKDLEIASAVVNTLGGAIKAFMGGVEVAPGPYGLVLGALLAATTLATGYASIRKMQAVPIKGGGGGSSIGLPSIGNAPQIAASPLQTVNVNPNQVNQIADSNQQSGDQRVYVLESDITNAQNKVAIQQSANQFG